MSRRMHYLASLLIVAAMLLSACTAVAAPAPAAPAPARNRGHCADRSACREEPAPRQWRPPREPAEEPAEAMEEAPAEERCRRGIRCRRWATAVIAVVDEYLSNIPEGYMSVGKLDAFKAILETGAATMSTCANLPSMKRATFPAPSAFRSARSRRTWRWSPPISRSWSIVHRVTGPRWRLRRCGFWAIAMCGHSPAAGRPGATPVKKLAWTRSRARPTTCRRLRRT